MTRKLAGLAVLVTALVAAAATPAGAGPPEFDKAQGAGAFTCQPGVLPGSICELLPARVFEFEFSALQKGFGGHATGFITRRMIFPVIQGTARGRVTCLNVLGNTAVFGGFHEATDMPFYVWVVDNGPPGSSPPDLMSLFFGPPFSEEELALIDIPPGMPFVCPQPFPSPIGYFPVTSGNIVVEDESPGPPSLALG